MTKKDFENRNFTNTDVVNSIFHFVQAYLDGWSHKVLTRKVKIKNFHTGTNLS